jgi:hypothetical protein
MLVITFQPSKAFILMRLLSRTLIIVTDIKLKPSTLMKLKDLDNLVRLVHWWAARERTATILYFKQNDRYIMGTMTSIPGWYDLQGMPLFLYVETTQKPKGVFIKYKADPEEQWDYAKGTFDRAWMYIPLIELSVVPEFLKNL